MLQQLTTKILGTLLMVCLSTTLFSQIEQYAPQCQTPNLDSATSVALPYFGNNQVLVDHLINNGYYDLQQISFPGSTARASTTTTFLEPKYLIPVNIYIYRNGANDPSSAITEGEARDFVCSVNTLYRETNSSVQFYVNRVVFEANETYNNQISSGLGAVVMWASKRLIVDNSKGINIHFIRHNVPPEDANGRASLPQYPNSTFEYSLYVRTHENGSSAQRSDVAIASTLSHELGHVLGLLHTHHPGRLLSAIFNSDNGMISNGCLQESVSRVKKNYWYQGCFGTDNMLKCEINGDFLCDTNGDPNQNGGSVSSSPDCDYIPPSSGDYRVDNWDELWNPPTENIMSYSLATCRKYLSLSQVGILWMEMNPLVSYINFVPHSISPTIETLCSGQSQTFQFSGTFPADATITWAVYPSTAVTTPTGTGTVANLTVASGAASGATELIFTITGPGNCYVSRAKTKFWVGPPSVEVVSFSNIYDGGPYFCDNMTGNSFEVGSVGGPSATWHARLLNFPSMTVAYTSPYSYYQGGPHDWNYVPVPNNGYYIFELKGTNVCGTSSWLPGYEVEYLECGSYFEDFTMAYPNPTSGTLEIDYDKSLSVQSGDLQRVQFYESSGEMVGEKILTLEELPTIIDLSNLRNGLYTLKFIFEKRVKTQRIMVKK